MQKKLINEAKRNKLKALDLSFTGQNTRLYEIPSEIFDLEHLEELSLFNNGIRIIPGGIKRLKNLKILNIALNPVSQASSLSCQLILDWQTYKNFRGSVDPSQIEGIWLDLDRSGEIRLDLIRFYSYNYSYRELFNLKNLKTLNIISRGFLNGGSAYQPDDEFKNLLDSIGLFGSLESLSIYGVELKEFPLKIRALPTLKTLSLIDTSIKLVPHWINELKSISRLSLQSNSIRYLPDSFAELSNLESLFLSDNPIEKIPNQIFELKNLKFLDISSSSNSKNSSFSLIKEISEKILELENLEELYIGGLPIEMPPAEVAADGLTSIKNYWKQNLETGVDYLCEAKLIVVGEAGAGKTTLAQKILDSAYVLKPQEESTEGIDVIRWNFPTAVRIKIDGNEGLFQTQFKVGIWDFGGQEIYHATHQFFLTKRSLYVLVVDNRKEDTDFNYWLQIVNLLSDGSPLIIIQNEKQDRQRGIDTGNLRARFPNLKEVFRTNLDTNRGLENFKKSIQHELEKLPHIGSPLLKTWTQVRTELENDQRNHISLDEYFLICQRNGFLRQENKLQLGRYLHDLGICLHFQDDPVLKNIVILKPKWGTNAVYKILDDQAVLDNKGKFDTKDLLNIWSDEEYSSMRDELLHLMMRFKLCYRLGDTDRYIAPQMLSPEQPAYPWSIMGQIVIRYEYDFMPKGILARFIVALNHLIKDQRLVWKHGVVLKRKNTQAEIIEDYSRHRIVVRVNGNDSPGLLAIIDDHIEQINESFPKLLYKKLLPCNCEICKKSDEPYLYPLAELMDFAKENDKIQCRISRKLIDAVSLIKDVLPSALNTNQGVVLESNNSINLNSMSNLLIPNREVFISYAWGGESTEIVETLEHSLGTTDIKLIRDQNELDYKDSIQNFMKSIGKGKAVIIILSKKYLMSTNCMFELSEIFKHGNFKNRIFPIILSDANIYSASGRLQYAKYWENKKIELDNEIKEISGEDLHGIREELDLFAKNRRLIGEITNTIKDMNALTPNQHRGTNFESLIAKLQSRLSE